MALTIRQFLNWLEPGKAYGIIEEGHYQVIVAEFAKLSDNDLREEVDLG